ncbi:MAG: hypothetical protein HZB39_08895 [Planctomycetes bacterium]|nr:hypothetical protein [Planctomycetota bacterium]
MVVEAALWVSAEWYVGGRRIGSVTLPPSSDHQIVEVLPEPAQWSLRVRVHGAGFSGPISGATVRVRHEPVEGGGKAEEREIRADASGIARWSGFSSGALTVTGPGYSEVSGRGGQTRIIASPYAPPQELDCVVLATDRLHRVRSTVRFDSGVTLRRAKLFFRAMVGRGELYPQDGELNDAGVFEVRVPTGAYDLDVLPLGEVEVLPKTIRVSGDQDIAVQVRRAVPLRRIALRGIDRADWPLRVAPQVETAMVGHEPGLLFLGEQRLTSDSFETRWAEPGTRLVAIARQASYVTTTTIPAGDDVIVDFVPATLLHVAWLTPPSGEEGAVTLVVRAGGLELSRTMGCRLVPVGQALLPAATAECAIPRGRVEAAAFDVSGRELWRRETTVSQAREWLMVAADG